MFSLLHNHFTDFSIGKDQICVGTISLTSTPDESLVEAKRKCNDDERCTMFSTHPNNPAQRYGYCDASATKQFSEGQTLYIQGVTTLDHIN